MTSAQFEEQVRHAISKYGLLQPGRRVIVAVSGGADSLALLNVLNRLGYDCVAAHCNFHLRGEESNRDMRHVEAATKKMDVDLCVRDFDVEKRTRDTGESLEMACRELRYAWFADLLDREHAQAVAVGHHSEDQLETFFINILRGAGITGLSGMRHRNGHVIRPLLELSRKDIEEYLVNNGIEWIVDSSNESDEFLRNRIRNRLIPSIEAIFPDFARGVLRSMSILRENERFYTHAISEHAIRYANPDTSEIDLKKMIEEEEDAALLLFEILKSEGYRRSQTDDMLNAGMRSGGIFKVGDSHLRYVDHGMLRAPQAGFKSLGSSVIDVDVSHDIFEPIRIAVTWHDIAEFEPERNPRVIFIDEKAVTKPHKWQLRRPKKADRFKPFGMQGTKLVSDIMAQVKLSHLQKSQVWLLTCDDQIVWVTGIRAGSHFTLGPSTRRYLRLELLC